MRYIGPVIIPLTAFFRVVFSVSVVGVAPDNQDKYVPDKNGNWRCLNNPEIIISFDKVNDDYCDCPDGSDEPGTSACPNGKFYCENKGHFGQYIDSYKVHDGVCDYEICCDGSDENNYEEGYIPCPDKCKEINEDYNKRKDSKVKLVTEGLKIKEKLIEKSKNLVEDIKDEKIRLQNDVNSIEMEINELENSKASISVEDADENGDTDNKSGNSKFISQVNQYSSKLEKYVSSVDTNLQLYKSKIKLLETILLKMTNEYNHNFNDPAVKEAANAYQDYIGNSEYDEVDTSSSADLLEEFKSLSENLASSNIDIASPNSQFQQDQLLLQNNGVKKCKKCSSGSCRAKEGSPCGCGKDSCSCGKGSCSCGKDACSCGNESNFKSTCKCDKNIKPLVYEECSIPKAVSLFAEGLIDKFIGSPRSTTSTNRNKEQTVENETKEDHDSQDYVSKEEMHYQEQNGNSKVVPAKLREIEKNIEELTKEQETKISRINEIDSDLINSIESTSQKYGPDDILRAFDPTDCISSKVGEYTYEYCITGTIFQKSSNGQSTLIGKFDKIEKIEPELNNGNEDFEDATLKLFYERGSRCWNGPIRRATAYLECGSELNILNVGEPEKCEYSFKITSPIACFEEDMDKF
ncbi:hypothetical protein B5S33_g5056 [[Candida] boidinii]|nr:hypothetical protein B5S33_g5056 [[Candida] boidinii]